MKTTSTCTKTVTSAGRWLNWTLISTLVLGCSSTLSTGDVEPQVDQDQAAIIGGAQAPSTVLDAVGSISVIDDYYNEIFPLCTATLLNSETVVTARHCVDVLDDLVYYDYRGGFSVGADGNHPTQTIAIASVETPDGSFGGFVGMGRDVAVLHLSQPVRGTFNYPEIGSSLDLEVGDQLIGVGYGVYSTEGSYDDQRRIGRETVAAKQGRSYEVMFGEFESFVEWYYSGQVTALDAIATFNPSVETLAWLHRIYDENELIPDYEVFTGLAAKDTNTCYGDSGGPLLRANPDGTFTTYGVVSGGVSSVRSVCDFGTAYAAFGPDIVDFLLEQSQWVDPCGDVTETGTCSGDTLQYCHSLPVAGIREIESEDCASQGVSCVQNAYGAGCGSAPQAPDAGTDAGSSTSAPADTLDVDQMLKSRFFPSVQHSAQWAK